ncbi:DegT/DnrJ/EryC1/StrS family aminotransferase [Humidesulfovibrio sp.]
MNIPFRDLRVTDPAEKAALLKAVEGVLDHGRMINGPELDQLEAAMAEYSGRRFAVGVASGTMALLLGLKGLGIGPGDEVITTSLSWIATANAVALTGATAVFADIKDDLTIDPASVKRLITSRTKAVIPVNYTARMCDMPALEELCAKHKLLLVEDAAQSFGSRLNGHAAGHFGQLSCFSMNAMKVFASCGEAGMLLTDDEALRDKLVALRYNGTVNRETCLEPSLNGRMETMQAAILLARLALVPGIMDARRQRARWYEELLTDVVDLPLETPGHFHSYYTYTIQADRRDELKTHLEARGVETQIQHVILMPDQPPYRGCRAETDNARRVQARILCIPANEKTTRAQVEYVAAAIRSFYGV